MFFSCRVQAATGRRRVGFTKLDLLALLFCMAALLSMGCPWIYRNRTNGRRNYCLSNIRQLALSVANFESATKRFPTVSDAQGPLHRVAPGTFGSDPTDSAGYSWLVKMLPYIEEMILFDELAGDTDRLTTRPFDSEQVIGADLYWSRQLPAYHCPNYLGERIVDTSYGSEYDSLFETPAISNYVALVGTHANADGTIEENGAIVSRCATSETCDGKGLKIKNLQDGISQTVIICETAEPIYSAWIDGQSGWVVGGEASGLQYSPEQGVATAAWTMINAGADPMDNVESYSALALPGGWPGALPRHWGPSSHHSGNVVIHGFADAHAMPISKDVDPTLYLRIITRGGGERTELDEL